MKPYRLILLAAALVLVLVGFGYAATDTASLLVNATVAAKCELTLNPTTINFPDADPDTIASIPADSTVAVTIKVKTAAGTDNVTLKCLSGGDLVSGTDYIAISNVSWTASGTGFSPGTMNKTVAQDVGTWSGSGKRTGTLTYALVNSWSYPVGSYAATVT